MNDRENIRPILEASMANQREAKQILGNMGYTYDPELSTNESKVFIDKEGNPNIAFRGSKRIEDFLITDPLLAFGLEGFTTRFTTAKDLTKKVEEKYGKPADAFGFSLGGSLAEKSGASGKIVTYNKGTGILDIGRTIPKNQIDIRTPADKVSALATTQKHKYGNLVELNKPWSQDILTAHKINNLPNNFFV